MPQRLCSIGYLCQRWQVDPATLTGVAELRGVAPVLFIDGVPYYDGEEATNQILVGLLEANEIPDRLPKPEGGSR